MNKIIIVILIIAVGGGIYLFQTREKENDSKQNNDVEQVEKEEMEEEAILQVVYTIIEQNQDELEKYEGDKREIEKFLYPLVVRNVKGQSSPVAIKNAISKAVNEIY